MESELKGRVALVTGASGGIGRAIAGALAGAQVRLALTYASHQAVAEDLAARINADGGTAIALHADLAAADAPGALVDAVEAELGPIEILVANAGRGVKKTLEELTTEEFDQTLAVNLRAPFLLAQRTLPGMRRRRYGRMLFISSVAGFIGGAVGPHYGASKAGVHALAHQIASSAAADGVTANAIAPALIEDTYMLPGTPDELAQKVPVGRLGKPAEVADLALAVLNNGYITNQVISIDGGMYPR
jgi:3-oxoacyl-[acyl-carrier protein] reductase